MRRLRESFRPEFLNRIDEIIVFRQLDQAELQQITELLLQETRRRMHGQGVTARFTPAAVDWIAEHGYQPEFGARPMRRTIQRDVDNQLSRMLLNGELVSGQDITIDVEDGRLAFDTSDQGHNFLTWSWRGSAGRGGDGLDLDQLAWVAQDRNAEQRARHVVIGEDGGDLVPGGDQIAAVAAGDVDGGLEHVPDRHARLLQRGPQVGEGMAHLRGHVAGRGDVALLIDRAGARGADQTGPVGYGGVRVRGPGIEPGAADEVDGHATGFCHRAAPALARVTLDDSCIKLISLFMLDWVVDTTAGRRHPGARTER